MPNYLGWKSCQSTYPQALYWLVRFESSFFKPFGLLSTVGLSTEKLEGEGRDYGRSFGCRAILHCTCSFGAEPWGEAVETLFLQYSLIHHYFSLDIWSKHYLLKRWRVSKIPLKAPICLKVLVNVVFVGDSPFGISLTTFFDVMGFDAQLPGFCKQCGQLFRLSRDKIQRWGLGWGAARSCRMFCLHPWHCLTPRSTQNNSPIKLYTMQHTC